MRSSAFLMPLPGLLSRRSTRRATDTDRLLLLCVRAAE